MQTVLLYNIYICVENKHHLHPVYDLHNQVNLLWLGTPGLSRKRTVSNRFCIVECSLSS